MTKMGPKQLDSLSKGKDESGPQLIWTRSWFCRSVSQRPSVAANINSSFAERDEICLCKERVCDQGQEGDAG